MRGTIRVVDIAVNAEAILNECECIKQKCREMSEKTHDEEKRYDLGQRHITMSQRQGGIMLLLNGLRLDTYKDKLGRWRVDCNEVDDGHDADYEEQKGDCPWL